MEKRGPEGKQYNNTTVILPQPTDQFGYLLEESGFVMNITDGYSHH